MFLADKTIALNSFATFSIFLEVFISFELLELEIDIKTRSWIIHISSVNAPSY